MWLCACVHPTACNAAQSQWRTQDGKFATAESYRSVQRNEKLQITGLSFLVKHSPGICTIVNKKKWKAFKQCEDVVSQKYHCYIIKKMNMNLVAWGQRSQKTDEVRSLG